MSMLWLIICAVPARDTGLESSLIFRRLLLINTLFQNIFPSNYEYKDGKIKCNKLRKQIKTNRKIQLERNK